MTATESLTENQQKEFEAVDRGDRGVGIRNNVLVLPSVICSHMVADRIADRVPGAVSTPHDHGCAQLGADNEQTKRTLIGVGSNPNIAGVVVVGLGCEEVQSDHVAADLDDLGVPVRELSIQDVGGTEACIADGTNYVTDLQSTATVEQTTGTLNDLTVGIVSSDLHPSTRETADPLIGALTDRIVDAGGRVLIGGTERLVPHRERLKECATDSAISDLRKLVDRYADRPSKHTKVRRTAADCSLREVTRSQGTALINSVLEYGERASFDSGVGFVDTPAQFEEAATGLAAAGAQIVIHATADGIPTGHPVVPTLKVTGDSDTADALSEDIDIDATSTSTDDLLDSVVNVADGKKSCAEEHGLTEFALTRVGPTM